MRGYYKTLILIEVTHKATDAQDAAEDAAVMGFQAQATLEDYPRTFIRVVRTEEA